jgi:drug/metabolite transporter (DMT)-like permease
MRDRRFLLGSLALILSASGFGLLGPVARLAYEAGFEPMAFVGWRGAFGLLAILAFIAVQARRGVPIVNPLRLPRRDRVGLAVIAVAGLAINISTFVAFDLTTVALVLLAFYTYPALVAVVAVVLGHERLDGARVLALGLASGGMVLVVAGGLDPAVGAISIHPLGLALGLVAAIAQTIFVTVSRGRFTSLPSEQAMAWVVALIAVTCLPLAAAMGAALDVPLHDGRALGLAVLAGTVGAGMPSVLFLVGIRAIGGTRAGILMLIEPVVGVTLAAVLLHEALRPVQLVGGGAILAAALLLQRGTADDRTGLSVVAVAEHP